MIVDFVFAKFMLVGIINTLAGSAVMFALYNLAGWDYWPASAANYIVGSILSFFLNKYWTFKVRKRAFSMVIVFIINIAVCYLLAYGIAKPAVHFLLKDSAHIIRDNAALFTGMCLFTGLNYIGQRFVVFKKNHSDTH
ncbi:MAG: GtrA family protein [Treponema sp.]|jgi:putative flippase GtrA|nr:GtrA family protein [Treponema sp.]